MRGNGEGKVLKDYVTMFLNDDSISFSFFSVCSDASLGVMERSISFPFTSGRQEIFLLLNSECRSSLRGRQRHPDSRMAEHVPICAPESAGCTAVAGGEKGKAVAFDF